MNDATRLLKLVAVNDICIRYLGGIELDLDLLNSRFHRFGFLATKDTSSKPTQEIDWM